MQKLLKHKMSICLVLGGLLIGLAVGIFFVRVSNPDAVDATILRFSSPVVATMTYRIDREGTHQLNGSDSSPVLFDFDVEYRFTNCGVAPIKLSFPPSRVFQFDRHSCFTSTELPDFARESRVVSIAPGETVMFEGRQGMLTGNFPTFAEGGPGSTAFVFSRPANETSDDGYCVGTVFPVYYVLGEDEDMNAAAIADRNKKAEQFIRSPSDAGEGE